MSQVVFFIAAIGALAGATGVVVLRNPFYAVLSLVSHLLCLALLFLLLRAEFVAAAQVVVYAGAVMVLYVFVVAYVGGADQPMRGPQTKGQRLVAAAFGIALFVELAIAVLGSGLKALDHRGAGFKALEGPAASGNFGAPGRLGQDLLTNFLLPFELASFLLLIAAVGAVTLARRRGGLETQAELQALTPLDFVRPATSGTMAEGVGPQHSALPSRPLIPGGVDDDPDREKAGSR